MTPPNKLMVDVDRHLFASAISNVLQNAFKFTRIGGHVRVRVHSTEDRVSIEVEDECGGLLPGAADALFRGVVAASSSQRVNASRYSTRIPPSSVRRIVWATRWRSRSA